MLDQLVFFISEQQPLPCDSSVSRECIHHELERKILLVPRLSISGCKSSRMIKVTSAGSPGVFGMIYEGVKGPSMVEHVLQGCMNVVLCSRILQTPTIC